MAEVDDWAPVGTGTKEVDDWAPVGGKPAPDVPKPFMDRVRAGAAAQDDETLDRVHDPMGRPGPVFATDPFEESAARTRRRYPQEERKIGLIPYVVRGLVGGMAESLATLPQRAIEDADVLQKTGEYGEGTGGKMPTGLEAALLTLGTGTKFSRTTLEHTTGAQTEQTIGGLPQPEDFKAGAEALAAPEKIVSAAVQAKDGTIFTGVHHGEAASKAKEAGYPTGSYLERSDGFVTSNSRYVDRKEAKLIADRAEQIGSRAMEGEGSSDLMAHQIFDEKGKPYSPAAIAEQRLRDKWEQDGIHPAEAVHDARADTFLKHELTAVEAYHGSPHDFEAFDASKTANGIWLSQDSELAGHYTFGKGTLYKVNVHAPPESFIDRNKPIVQQSESVRSAITEIEKSLDIPRREDATGASFYAALSRRLAGDDPHLAGERRANELLREQNVPGIKDDAGVFIAFDDSTIEITHKNGEPFYDSRFHQAVNDKAERILDGEEVGEIPLRAVGAEVTSMPPLTSPAVQPLQPPGRLMAAVRDAGESLFDIGRDIQMKVAPMATGSHPTMAIAKDFANRMRRNRWEWAREDADIAKTFDPEQRKRMWEAGDEESVARQLGESREHQGLVTLEPAERAAVERQHAQLQATWLQMVDRGMVKGEGLPAYTPRMIINVASATAETKALPLNGIGTNLRTRTGNMMRRKYMMAEETEAAAKAKYGEDAELARDIRALPLANAQMQDALAGRQLIDNIKDYGKRTGDETVAEGFKPTGSDAKWFTIDHPAFRTWKVMARDADGEAIGHQVPIYVRGDFEGPLRAVLTEKSGPLYSAMMSLKGKTMSLIMNSPLIHNAVEFGRAFPAMPIRIFKAYFDGNRAKNDPAIMGEAIDNGLVPIGKRFFNQDITSIMESPDLTPGRSWTAKLIGAVPGLFDEAAGAATKRAIDKAGDFWHNTLLWDRIADLQMGLYTNLRGDLLTKGVDQQTASRVAAHMANRYAGALPQEAMSQGAAKVANFLMFSRTFTIGNLGVMKDALTGLPKDVMAQIERDMGVRFNENTFVGYHGTNAVFDKFSDRYLGTGVGAEQKAHFFSSDPSTASGYAGSLGDTRQPNVRRAQLSFENPKVVEFKDHKIKHIIDEDEKISSMIDQAQAAGHDGLVLKGINGKEGKDVIASFGDDTIENLPFGAKPSIPSAQAAVDYAKTLARRKAFATVVADVGLLYVGNSILQSALNVMLGDSSMDKEMHGYVRRAKEAFAKIEAHPLEMTQYLDLAGDISSTSENEPGKQDRLKIGYDKNGTAIYARSPFGKIGEEFVGYLSGPLDMARRKEGTIARPLSQIWSNDKGFGRKVYDPDAHTPLDKAYAIWQMVEHLGKSQTPEGQFNAFSDLVKGEGDPTVNKLQAFGPLAGVTFSKGAPGGEARGEALTAKTQLENRFNLAWPAIRKQFQRGDYEGAQQALQDLRIPHGWWKGLSISATNPAARLNGRALKQFFESASPAQIERMERLQQQPPPQ